MKTRLLSLLVLAALLLGMAACADPAAGGEPAASTAGGEPAEPAASTAGLGIFIPSRLNFVEMLAEAAGDTLPEDGETPFRDAPDSAALAWAYDAWLLGGDGNGAFRPDDPITRQEAAVILSRYLDYRYTDLPAGCGTGQPDVSGAAPWARDEILRCWLYGVITAGDGEDFRPAEVLTFDDAQAWIAAAQAVRASALAPAETATFADALTAAAAPETGSWLYAPDSLRLCLAMLANGAEGETRAQLLAALQIDDLDAFNRQVQARLAQYDGFAEAIRLNTASSLWLNQSRFGGQGAFRENFADTLETYYRAEAGEVTDDDSVERINAWAGEATEGRIPTILTEENREFAAVIANAVYFRAAWADEFSPANTAPGAFTGDDGAVTTVDFLRQTGSAGYYATPGVQAVELAFRNYTAEDETGAGFAVFPEADFSMYFILADDPDFAVEAFLNQAQFQTGPVRMAIPKFTLEYGGSLTEALQALGVSDAFAPARADLSPMVDGTLPGDLFLNDVAQKSYLSIDEEGAEAAAVTVAVATDSAVERPPMVRTFTADRPFYFAIRDNASGTLLFVGRCAQLP